MAIQFSGGKCHGAGEAKAMMRHADRDERLVHNHTNQDVNKSRTHLNTDLNGLSYREMCDRYDEIIRGYQKKSSRAIRKDAVTLYDAIITVPKDLPKGREDDWYRDVEKTINIHYGKRVVLDIKIHRDEIHEYVDPSTKKTVMSRTHGHCFMIPDVDGRLNGKKFSSRSNMVSLNREIDELTREKYQCQFLTGEKTVDRGFQTVEQLKRSSDVAEAERHLTRVTRKLQETQKELSENLNVLTQTSEWIKQSDDIHQKIVKEIDQSRKSQKNQIEDAKRYIDELDQEIKVRKDSLDGLDISKKVQEISDELDTDRTPKVKPLRETDPKTTLLGEHTQGTVTITKKDFDQLLEISEKAIKLTEISEKISEMMKDIKQWSDRAFMSKVDTEKIYKEVQVDRRVQDIKKDLEESRYQWEVWETDSRSKDTVIQSKDEDIRKLQKTIQSRVQDISTLQTKLQDQERLYEKVKSAYPKWLRAVEKVIQYEKAFDGEGLTYKDYDTYVSLCKKSHLSQRDDIQEVFEEDRDLER